MPISKFTVFQMRILTLRCQTNRHQFYDFYVIIDENNFARTKFYTYKTSLTKLFAL